MRVQLKDPVPTRAAVRGKATRPALRKRDTSPAAAATVVKLWYAERAGEGVELVDARGGAAATVTLRKHSTQLWCGVSGGALPEYAVVKAAWKVDCAAGTSPEVAVGVVPQGFLDRFTGDPHPVWMQGVQTCARAFLWCPEGSVFMPKTRRAPAAAHAAGRVISLHGARMVHRTEKWSRGDILQVQVDLATSSLALFINQQAVLRVPFEAGEGGADDTSGSGGGDGGEVRPLEFVAILKGRATSLTLMPPDKNNYGTAFMRVKHDEKETVLQRMTMHELQAERPPPTFFTSAKWRQRSGGKERGAPPQVAAAGAASPPPGSPATPVSFDLSPSVAGGDAALVDTAAPSSHTPTPLAASPIPTHSAARTPTPTRMRPTTAGMTRGPDGRIVYGNWSSARRESPIRPRPASATPTTTQDWRARSRGRNPTPTSRERSVQAARSEADARRQKEAQTHAEDDERLSWREDGTGVAQAPPPHVAEAAALAAQVDHELREALVAESKKKRPATATPMRGLTMDNTLSPSDRLTQLKPVQNLETITHVTPWAGEQTGQKKRAKRERAIARALAKKEGKAREEEANRHWQEFLKDRSEMADNLATVDLDSLPESSSSATTPMSSPRAASVSQQTPAQEGHARTPSPEAASPSCRPALSPRADPFSAVDDSFLASMRTAPRDSPALSVKIASPTSVDLPKLQKPPALLRHPPTPGDLRKLFRKWEAGGVGGGRVPPDRGGAGENPLAWGRLVYNEMDTTLQGLAEFAPSSAAANTAAHALPPPLRTATACLILHRLVPLFKGYASLLMRCLYDVFQAVFTNFTAGLGDAGPEAALFRSPPSPKEAAVRAHKAAKAAKHPGSSAATAAAVDTTPHLVQPAFIALERYADRAAAAGDAAGLGLSHSGTCAGGGSFSPRSGARSARLGATRRRATRMMSLIPGDHLPAADIEGADRPRRESVVGGDGQTGPELRQMVEDLQTRLQDLKREYIYVELENSSLRKSLKQVHFNAWRTRVAAMKKLRAEGRDVDSEDEQTAGIWTALAQAASRRLRVRRWWVLWRARMAASQVARQKEIERRITGKFMDIDVAVGATMRPNLANIMSTAEQWAQLHPQDDDDDDDDDDATDGSGVAGTPVGMITGDPTTAEGGRTTPVHDPMRPPDAVDVPLLLLTFVRIHQSDIDVRVSNFGNALKDGAVLLGLLQGLPPPWCDVPQPPPALPAPAAGKDVGGGTGDGPRRSLAAPPAPPPDPLVRLEAWLRECPVPGVLYNVDHLRERAESMTMLFLTRLYMLWMRRCVKLMDMPRSVRTLSGAGATSDQSVWREYHDHMLAKYTSVADAVNMHPRTSCNGLEQHMMQYVVVSLVRCRMKAMEPVFVDLFLNHGEGLLRKCLLDPEVQAVLTEDVLLLLGSVFAYAAKDADQITLVEFQQLLSELQWLDGSIAHEALHLTFYLAQSSLGAGRAAGGGGGGGGGARRSHSITSLDDYHKSEDFYIDAGEFNDAVCILSAFFLHPRVSPREGSPRTSNSVTARIAAHISWFFDAFFAPDVRSKLPESVWDQSDSESYVSPSQSVSAGSPIIRVTSTESAATDEAVG